MRSKVKMMRPILVVLGLCSHLLSFAQQVDVKGQVTEAQMPEGVPGVSVQVKGGTAGTMTDIEGRYAISVPPNATLVFSSIGYESQEIRLGSQTTLNVVLNTADNLLEQVVVVGYGEQRKAEVTGAIVNVKGEEIYKQASTNAVSALQGKVAGVQINNTGRPGDSPQIRIRGLGTVYGNANPLYIVDGVWFDDISFLNPADIESMSILKDASAQSIYGIRAANGVVLVTTRRGKADHSVVSYNGYVGVQSVTNPVKMANADEYGTLVNELSVLNGGQPLVNQSYGEGTSWADEILRKAFITNHQLTLSGGSQKSNYSFSLGYLNQNGIVRGNGFKRYTARMQNDYKVFKPVKVGYTLIASMSDVDDTPNSVFTQIYGASPIVPVFNPVGSYGDPADYNLGDGANYNPRATLDFYNRELKKYKLNGSVYAEVQINEFLKWRSSFGGDFGEEGIRGFTPKYAATLTQRSDVSVLSVERNERRNWILENTLTIDKTFQEKHNLKVLLGQGAQRYKNYNLKTSAQNVPNNSEGDWYLKLGDVGSASLTDNGDLYTIASYFGRVNYDFASKYMLTASLRADGASKFYAGGNAWGVFPSVGLGWTISEESFMKNQTLFDNLKLRASWGKIGNASVPNNIAVLRVDQKDAFTAIFGDQPYTGASINSIVPPVTFWERGVGTDLGLEGSLWNSRLSFEFDFYDKKTEQAIFDIPILGSIGTSSGSIVGNQATFQNRGFEAALTWRNKRSSDFSYTISGNVGINNNKVLEVVTGENPIYGGGSGSTGGALATRTIVGQPIGQFFGYQVEGVFQNQEEVDASAQKSAKPGDFRYKDVNGDGSISGLDRVALGNPNPKYTYGINSNFQIHAFDLTLDLQGVADVDVFNGNIGKRYGNENFTKAFYDNRWHGEGTSNTYPSANLGGGQNYLPNSFFVENGSYFRVRNLQVGYSLPKSLLDSWKMQKFRIYANAQNPLTLFRYSGFTPEVVGTQSENKDIATSIGIDNNVYPLSATYNIGLNITF
ncbi:TonB-dependent receptor [Marinilongibacter aquaticus]|uniref:SusC/RagA family TonB-linked outer membrane protein n=1 Tax=Marinilongibacter aquaticus TaxID=2975157 RepID=UPI0021BD86D6|nr:TonB-dependent receptor [Marinilongibacter aquaticus]UBM59041.1 TonB-dependent receptor [Marinilongibacter aquaticus]